MMITIPYRLLAPVVALAALAACDIDPEIAPPFSPTGNGIVSGLVFFDADGDGQFSPVLGDTHISGATLSIASRGDSTRVIAEGTSGAQGTFTIADVPVGSYELRAIVPGATSVTCAPVPVTVYVGESSFASTPTRVSCRIDIAVAKTRELAAIVTVGGIVSAAPGVYRPNNLYLQDATGGMQAFNVPGGTASGISLGDSIEITGPLGQFGQELQVSPVNTFRIVRADARVLDPRDRTIAQLKAEFEADGNKARSIGELIVVRGVTVAGLPAANSTGSGTDFRLVQGTDTLNIRLDQAANTNIPVARFAADGACFDVVGILGYFSPNLQLKPRDVNDVTTVTCPAP